MTPTYEIITGDALVELPKMASGSVHCCVTSPPYWGLRDYGTATWDGGDAACDHKPKHRNVGAFTGQTTGTTHEAAEMGASAFKNSCGHCGAVRIDAQLGLEPSPDEYVAKMVRVFAEVRRVLRDDGTLWLNLGDSYAGARPAGGGTMAGFNDRYFGRDTDGGKQSEVDTSKPARGAAPGLKAKDLCGIPWMVAFALRADGWYLRSDIIWHKPNPMPESVTDRPTKAHEYLFLMSKSERYYYDHEAIKEPFSTEPNAQSRCPKDTDMARGPREGGNAGLSSMATRMRDGIETTRNKRSVWTVATHPFPDAHFATFPPKLIEPCIKAGCPAGGIVLDPFTGAGTTGLVAARQGVGFVGIELNPTYADMARARCAAEAAQGKLFAGGMA